MIRNDERLVVDMESLALHELGHLLGLSHVDQSLDRYSIMNPSLLIGEGLITRNISRGDIARLQKIYGCAGTACDIEQTFLAMEQSRGGNEQKFLPRDANASQQPSQQEGQNRYDQDGSYYQEEGDDSSTDENQEEDSGYYVYD